MSTLYEIPLASAQPTTASPIGTTDRTMTIQLSGGVYKLRFFYADGWALDISTATGTPLLCGLMLVPGGDLLEPYPDLGIGGKLYVETDQADGSPPSFQGFGVDSHVYYESP